MAQHRGQMAAIADKRGRKYGELGAQAAAGSPGPVERKAADLPGGAGGSAVRSPPKIRSNFPQTPFAMRYLAMQGLVDGD